MKTKSKVKSTPSEIPVDENPITHPAL